MRRILASLFVIGALLAGGVFATGAYFQFQGAGPSFQIVTGTATLTATPVGGTLGGSPLVVGPGFDQYACIRITNDRDFPLNVTQSLAFTAGNAALEPAMFLSINTGANCSISYGTDYASTSTPVRKHSARLWPSVPPPTWWSGSTGTRPALTRAL